MLGFLSIRKSKSVCDTMWLIGTDADDGGIDWEVTTEEYCLMMYKAGVLKNRGYEVLNSIVMYKFYLPPPQHTYTTGP
jgi:hypothetical protein